MFGLWPSCAYNGCPFPAVCRLKNVSDGHEISVDLCPVHFLEGQKAIAEMRDLRALEHKEEDHSDLLLP